jgi:ferredoxin-type protein NapH
MSQPRDAEVALPVVQPDAPPRSRMGRRRAAALVIVHLLVLAHIAHYVWWGRTMTPLEPSEARESLVTGAVNAGAILLAVLILATLVLGRFFCGWACHVVAYQDLARWFMLKLGVRPKPVRSRLLLFVPLFAAFWLYVKPVVERLVRDDETSFQASLHLVTDDFWRTFPGPTITILTFLICGFLIVYVLGSKGFCTYGCPYGGLFAIADRFAKGRIRVTDACDGSAQCTINCSSNVNVAREVREYGMVVDPGCLKCMDCISVCPNDALYFGFGPVKGRLAWLRTAETALASALATLFLLFWWQWKVGLLAAVALTVGAAIASRRRPGSRTRSDFTTAEELFLAGTFAVAFAITFDLFNIVPLLMALGVAVIVAFLMLRGLRRPFGLAGGGAVILVMALGYGAFVQWHTRAAFAAIGEAESAYVERDETRMLANARLVEKHVGVLDRWSVFHISGMGRWMGEVQRWQGRPEEALAWYAREQVTLKQNPLLPLLVGLAKWQLGETGAAWTDIDGALVGDEVPAERFLRANLELRRLGATRHRLEVLVRGHTLHPANADLALQLGTLLVQGPDPTLHDLRRALEIVEATSIAGDRSHAEVLGLLAWLYNEAGRHELAVQAAEDAATLAREKGDERLAGQMRQAAGVYRQAGAADH